MFFFCFAGFSGSSELERVRPSQVSRYVQIAFNLISEFCNQTSSFQTLTKVVWLLLGFYSSWTGSSSAQLIVLALVESQGKVFLEFFKESFLLDFSRFYCHLIFDFCKMVCFSLSKTSLFIVSSSFEVCSHLCSAALLSDDSLIFKTLAKAANRFCGGHLNFTSRDHVHRFQWWSLRHLRVAEQLLHDLRDSLLYDWSRLIEASLGFSFRYLHNRFFICVCAAPSNDR